MVFLRQSNSTNCNCDIESGDPEAAAGSATAHDPPPEEAEKPRARPGRPRGKPGADEVTVVLKQVRKLKRATHGTSGAAHPPAGAAEGAFADAAMKTLEGEFIALIPEMMACAPTGKKLSRKARDITKAMAFLASLND